MGNKKTFAVLRLMLLMIRFELFRLTAEFDPKQQIKLKKLTTEVSVGNCYEIYIYLNSILTNVSASLNLINSSSVGSCERQLLV